MKEIILNLIPLLCAVWSAFVLYAIIEVEDNFLKRRLKKTSKKIKNNTKRFMNAILELLKPLSAQNIKNIKFKKNIENLLIRVGLPSSEDDILDFETKRLLSLLILTIVTAFVVIFQFSMQVLAVIVFLYLVVYKFPEFRLKNLIKKREYEFTKFFPDAIDLMCVCIQAGLGVDSAIERTAFEFQNVSKIVSFEFMRLSKDITSGISRNSALKNLTQRIQLQDVNSFVAFIIQAEQMGTSIAQSLNIFSDTLRTRKKQRVEELVQSVSSKMTFPMVCFLLPALFIVILYPAVVKISESLAQ